MSPEFATNLIGNGAFCLTNLLYLNTPQMQVVFCSYHHHHRNDELFSFYLVSFFFLPFFGFPTLCTFL